MSRAPSSEKPGQTQPVDSLKGLRVLVVGLGRFGGGVGVTRWLVGEGAVVTVTDRAGPETLCESVRAVADLDITLHLGGHDPGDLDAADLVVVNPGVDKARSEFFQRVIRSGVPWTTEMNLFCRRCPAKIIGVTGSFGKSTTCAMLADALRAACDREVFLGGNIGCSLLPDIPRMSGSDYVVLEMSDVQLADLPRIGWAPPVAVIVNLHPHHLDRYSSLAAYIDAKLNIARDPEERSRIIVGDLHTEAATMLGRFVSDQPSRLRRVTRPDPPVSLRVPGDHNLANAACVLTVCDELGLDRTKARGAVERFEGLPHRLQHVRTLDGVEYSNDSKSTAPSATVVALESLDRSRGMRDDAPAAPRIVAIVGGEDKDAPLGECARALADRCRMVICTGQSGPKFAEAIRSCMAGSTGRVGTAHQDICNGAGSVGTAGRVGTAHQDGGTGSSRTAGRAPPTKVALNLEEAVRLARADARPGDIVLFSPGTPSFDAYVNYVARGEHFIKLVNLLA